jgi:hypothetical protein
VFGARARIYRGAGTGTGTGPRSEPMGVDHADRGLGVRADGGCVEWARVAVPRSGTGGKRWRFRYIWAVPRRQTRAQSGNRGIGDVPLGGITCQCLSF